MRNDGDVVASSPFLNSTTCKESGESVSKANKSKLSLEERKARKREYHKQYRADNKESIAAQRKQYAADNKEAISAYQKQWRAEKKEAILAYQKQWRAENKEAISAYQKQYQKQYQTDNKERIAFRKKKKRNEDVNYRIKDNLRSRLHIAVKNDCKSGSAVRDLGCSIEFLKENFKGQFYKDENGVMMTWENWGTVWELDHNYPLDAADLDDRTEFLAVNNWRNLQPLTCEENLKKSNKITPAARRLFTKLVKEFS
jgi:hypothetical protein